MESRKRKLNKAIGKLLLPVIRLVLRFGVGHAEFNAISKLLFVKAASDDFGKRGRPTNSTRVAAITGISRKEVAKLRMALESNQDLSSSFIVSPSNVISEWKANPEFRDSTGAPMALSYDDGDLNFSELARIAGPNVTPGALRDELIRVGCISQSEDGMLMLVRDNYYDGTSSPNRLYAGFSNSLRLHAETIFYNVVTPASEGSRFERIVWTDRLRNSDADSFRSLSRKRLSDIAQRVSDTIDDYEYMNATSDSEPIDDRTTAGVGLFYFETPNVIDTNDDEDQSQIES
ncbi:MAG: DUF6502 family protein [Pseudomonadota bacterium]